MAIPRSFTGSEDVMVVFSTLTIIEFAELPRTNIWNFVGSSTSWFAENKTKLSVDRVSSLRRRH